MLAIAHGVLGPLAHAPHQLRRGQFGIGWDEILAVE